MIGRAGGGEVAGGGEGCCRGKGSYKYENQVKKEIGDSNKSTKPRISKTQ